MLQDIFYLYLFLYFYFYIFVFIIFLLFFYYFFIIFFKWNFSLNNFLVSSVTFFLILFGLFFLWILFLLFYFFMFFFNLTHNFYFWSLDLSLFTDSLNLNLNFGYFFKLSPDFFGLVLLFIALVVGFISFFTLDTRIFFSNLVNFIICYLLVFCIFFYVFCTDIFLFFLCYEGLLLPSFWLVYVLSPNRRGIQASLYFLLWTQLGSFLILLFIIYLVIKYQTYLFNDLRFLLNDNNESWYLYLLLFFGFGFKVPIWPFHFWLTKTHVEAPTGFSIFLSGFLVKSALFGFYKYVSLLGEISSISVCLTICILGIIDSSFKMWGQSDLKKLVAYGTIQEMNIIFLTFLFGDSFFIFGGILFCITHALLSSLFFYLVDCIYRRFKTRNIVELQGLLHLTPNLGFFIFIGCLLYAGLPGTLKFICEVYIFLSFSDFAIFSTFFILFSANFIGILGFCKCWYNILFGMNSRFQTLNLLDLSIREVLIILICCFLLVFSGLGIFFIFY